LSEKYLTYFSKLRTDKNRKHWSALARHQAPHKPFLLLSIMDLVAQGAITDNIVQPTLELLDLAEKEQFWPARENLQWHSKRIFTQ
jgi:putative restriction endonuclease